MKSTPLPRKHALPIPSNPIMQSDNFSLEIQTCVGLFLSFGFFSLFLLSNICAVLLALRHFSSFSLNILVTLQFVIGLAVQTHTVLFILSEQWTL